jgi:hypothetical protein
MKVRITKEELLKAIKPQSILPEDAVGLLYGKLPNLIELEGEPVEGECKDPDCFPCHIKFAPKSNCCEKCSYLGPHGYHCSNSYCPCHKREEKRGVHHEPLGTKHLSVFDGKREYLKDCPECRPSKQKIKEVGLVNGTLILDEWLLNKEGMNTLRDKINELIRRENERNG